MIEQWRSGVRGVLNERHISSLQNIEKRHLHAAMLALDSHRLSMVQSFTATLADELADSLAGASSLAGDIQAKTDVKASKPTKSAQPVDPYKASKTNKGNPVSESRGFTTATSFDELELMGFSEVQDTVDRARVLQTVAMVCESDLMVFSARLSTAQGFAKVQVDSNPLRPEVFVQALLDAAHQAPVDNAVRSLWFTHGSELMGKQVQTLYLTLNDLLLQRGVAPAAYRVKSSPASKSSAPSYVPGLVSMADPAVVAELASAGASLRNPSAFAPLVGESVALPTIAYPPQASGDKSQKAKTASQLAQRDALAKKISAEILQRPDFVLDNHAVIAFLTGPWSLVLANERLVVDADKTGKYKAIFSLTLGELLWSLNREQTASYTSRLAKLSPSILERVRGGLLSVGALPADYSAFFDEVLAIHQRYIAAGTTPGSTNSALVNSVLVNGSQAPSEPKDQAKIKLNALFDAGDAAHGISSWLTPHARQIAPEHEKLRFQKTQPFLDTAPEEKPASALSPNLTGSIEFKLGAWVDLFADDQWLRAQLTWISLYNTLFIFTSLDGRTHSMTEPLLQYLLLQNLVKVVSLDGVLHNHQPVVPRKNGQQKRA